MHEITPPATLAESVAALLEASRRVLLVADDPVHAQQRLHTLAAAATRLEHQLDAAHHAGQPVDWAATVREAATARAGDEPLAAWVAQRRVPRVHRVTTSATPMPRALVDTEHRHGLR